MRAPDAPSRREIAAEEPKPQVIAEKPKSDHPAPTAASAEAKPKAPVRQVQQEPRERLPWERGPGYAPSYLGFQQGSPPAVPPPGPFRSLFGALFR